MENFSELISKKNCAELIVKKYEDLYEMCKGDFYKDRPEKEKELKEILTKLNSFKKILSSIMEEIENAF